MLTFSQSIRAWLKIQRWHWNARDAALGLFAVWDADREREAAALAVSVVRAIDPAAVKNGYTQRLRHEYNFYKCLLNKTTTFSLRLSLFCLPAIHETETCEI